MSVNVYAQKVQCRQVDPLSRKRRPTARTIDPNRWLHRLVLLAPRNSFRSFRWHRESYATAPLLSLSFVGVTSVRLCGVKFTVVRPGGLTVDPPTGTINVIKGEVSLSRRTWFGIL